MDRQAYGCAAVVTDDDELQSRAVIVEDGRIVAVCREAELPSDIPFTALDGAYLTAGLIDIHVHGAMGRGYNEADAEAARLIGRALLDAGITTALPTMASAQTEDLVAAIPTALADSGKDRPRLPGVHLEGPYLSPDQAGAQDLRALRNPSDGSVDAILELADRIKVVVVAPELPGALDLITRLTDAGIVSAAGHSNGTADDLWAAVDRGLSHITHIFSSQSTIRRRNARRVPGMLEGTLASDGLTVEMIADGHHLPDELMQMAHRCVGERLCLVSDASPGAGLSDGSEYRMADSTYVVEGGVGMTLDRTSFGGSTTLLTDMLPVARDALGITMPELIRMVTSVPAAAAKLDDVGRIAPGYRADFTLFDEHLRPVAVALGGEWQTLRKEMA